MPNLKSFTPLADNPDWIKLQFDDGTESHPVLDPSGTYRKEVEGIVGKLASATPPDPMAGAVAGPGGGEVAGVPVPVMPPTVSPERANSWMAAQSKPSAAPAPQPQGAAPAPPTPVAPIPTPGPALSPAPAAPVTPSRAAVLPPGPSGMPRSGAGRQTQGLAAADAERVDAATETAAKAGDEANREDYAAKATQYWHEFGALRENEKKQLAQQSVLEEQERQFNQRVDNAYAKLDAIQGRKIDPGEVMDEIGHYAFMAAFGDAVQNFGSAIAGRSPTQDPAARVEGIIDRYVKIQTAQKQADFEAGKLSASQLEAERETARLKLATVGKQLAETQLSLRHTEQEYMGLGALQKRMGEMQAKARANAAMATARTETLTDEFAPMKPTGPGKFIPTDAESRELEHLLGPKWEESYEKGMNSKVVSGENGATVQQALPMIHEMDQDLQTFKALKAANGGTIPQRGVLNVPKALVGALSRMGYTPGMNAEEANQLMTGYVLRKARSYGGAVTAPDYENAEKEFGQSGDGFIRGIERMRSSTANGVRQAIVTHFRGNGQRVLDISMGAYGRTGGVPLPKSAEEFEVQGGQAPAGAATPQTPGAPSDPLKTIREKGLIRGVSDALQPKSDGSPAPGSAM